MKNRKVVATGIGTRNTLMQRLLHFSWRRLLAELWETSQLWTSALLMSQMSRMSWEY